VTRWVLRSGRGKQQKGKKNKKKKVTQVDGVEERGERAAEPPSLSSRISEEGTETCGRLTETKDSDFSCVRPLELGGGGEKKNGCKTDVNQDGKIGKGVVKIPPGLYCSTGGKRGGESFPYNVLQKKTGWESKTIPWVLGDSLTRGGERGGREKKKAEGGGTIHFPYSNSVSRQMSVSLEEEKKNHHLGKTKKKKKKKNKLGLQVRRQKRGGRGEPFKSPQL